VFRGNHPTRVDEKGRLKVPADFKRVVDAKYGSTFYITSLDGQVAMIYPIEEWEKIESKLVPKANFNPSVKKYLNKVNYYGQTADVDSQGRLLLPQLLRESAQLLGDVTVQGNLSYLEVRNRAAAEALAKEEFTADDAKVLEDLGL